MVSRTESTDGVTRKGRKTKATLVKEIKLELLRYCMLWGFGEESSIKYFAQKGYKLSHTHYYELKKTLESDESIRGWYTETSLIAMERDHKMSYEQYDELEKVLLQEIQQLSATSVYNQYEDTDGNTKFVFNKNHDSTRLAHLIETFDKIKRSKADILSATPTVQAIMQKREQERQQQSQTENPSEMR